MLKITGAIAAASIVVALTGCAGVAQTGPAQSDPASPSPTTTPAADTGVHDDTMVVRFSATATADSGETAHLQLTVYAPHPLTPEERDRLTSAPCPNWESQFPDAVGMPIRLTTTQVSGVWPKYHFVAVQTSYLSTAHEYTASAWTGSWQTSMASCSDGVAVLPGEASGVLLVDPDTAPDADSWGTGTWGLTGEFGEDRPFKVTVADCSIKLGPAASLSPHLASMTSADATHGCILGWIGD